MVGWEQAPEVVWSSSRVPKLELSSSLQGLSEIKVDKIKASLAVRVERSTTADPTPAGRREQGLFSSSHNTLMFD